MEEEAKGGTAKASVVQLPTAKPRPVPRKRNQPRVDTTVHNGKPENIPPKPVVLPKPRRPPPNAPSVKPSEPAQKNVTDNNNKKPPVEEITKSITTNGREPSGKSINQTVETRNGPAHLDLKDLAEEDQWYEPIRPRQESELSGSEEGYDDNPAPRDDKITPPSPRKRSGASRDANPPLPSKVETAGKGSPPTPRKIMSTISKTSPPVLRKFGGLEIKTSPHVPRKANETRPVETASPNISPRTHDSSSASNKSKPLPPKKPLPSLPKDLSGQNTTTETSVGSKPSLPQKAPPELASSSTNDSSQPSVAALAQKLSTMPVFAFRDASSGRLGVSPRPSPHSSPRLTTRNAPSNSLLDKSESRPSASVTRTNEVAKPKLRPKPGAAQEKPQTQGHEVQKHPPARPSPPSAEAVARVRSRTVESLDDKENTVSGDTPAETGGHGNPSIIPKKRLATRVKTLQHGASRPSNDAVQANRRPPPLPPGAVAVMDKSSVKGPPLPPVPHGPRPASSYDQSQGGAARPHVSKSVSAGDIPRVATAEEQAEYSYAYEHAFLGASPPKRAQSARNPPTAPMEESDGTYVAPDENVVSEFMEELHEKKTAASYEAADELAVVGFMDSVRRKKQTLNGLTCELSTDESESSDSDDHEYTEPPTEEHEEDDEEEDSDSHEYLDPTAQNNEDNDTEDHDDASSESSFSSDSSHDYCVPPENISPPEPHPEGKGYDELESIYVEPICEPSEDACFSDDDKYSVIEEPLYQVYTRCTLQRERTLSRRRLSSDMSSNDEQFLEELAKGTLRNMRMLWCELPEVKASGILDTIKPDERKRQEAMFEVITSEASYLRSLNTLMSHFIKSDELSSGSSLCVLERGQSHVLFSNITAIKSVSESFLQALRARQKEAVVMSTISDIIQQHAAQHFEVYVKYCSNQIYQDRALKNLRKSVRFVEAVKKLQSGKEAQGLTLQSFLVLPMQRITRLPLLVNAICQRCEAGSEEFNKTDRALAAINKIVNDCNEGARKMERMEEICVLQTQIEFKTKPLALATPSRYLLRRGDIMQIVEDSRSPLKKLRLKFKPIYMFLFNDLLLLTKKKSENRFQVLDYATRHMTQVDEAQEFDMNVDHVFSLVLLENSDGKTKEFLMAGNSETDKTRWMEAFKPPPAEQEGETVYASWDCPQVNALHNYTAQQPDELSLYEGDVINVLKKLPDGWYHGERLCDGTQGWFPANHTEEILNEHVRARNLRQRYRLLAASKHLIGGTLKL